MALVLNCSFPGSSRSGEQASQRESDISKSNDPDASLTGLDLFQQPVEDIIRFRSLALIRRPSLDAGHIHFFEEGKQAPPPSVINRLFELPAQYRERMFWTTTPSSAL